MKISSTILHCIDNTSNLEVRSKKNLLNFITRDYKRGAAELWRYASKCVIMAVCGLHFQV